MFQIKKLKKSSYDICSSKQTSQYEKHFAVEGFNLKAFTIWQLANCVSDIQIFPKYNIEKRKFERKNKLQFIIGLLYFLDRNKQLKQTMIKWCILDFKILKWRCSQRINTHRKLLSRIPHWIYLMIAFQFTYCCIYIDRFLWIFC